MAMPCAGGREHYAALILRWLGGTFSWRWEKLLIFLAQLRARFDMMLEVWDAAKIASSAPAGDRQAREDDEDTKGFINRMTQALAIRGIKLWIEMLFLKVKAVCDEVEWMEQCYCHSTRYRKTTLGCLDRGIAAAARRTKCAPAHGRLDALLSSQWGGQRKRSDAYSEHRPRG